MGASLGNPLSLLSEYEQRGQQHVVDLSTAEDRREYWRSIAFMVGGVYMLLDERDADELLRPPQISPIPGTRRWVSGVANVRGELLPVIDFKDFLFGEPASPDKQSRVLVVMMDDVRSGLLVDQVMGVRRFPVDTFKQPQTKGLPKVVKQLMDGCYKEEEVFHVMSVKKLIEDTGFMQAAA